MNKIYVITEDYYEDGVLCNVRILGYVTSEEDAEKFLAKFDNDDIYYVETELLEDE